MKTRNRIILVLAIIGILAYGLMEVHIKPQIAERENQSLLRQRDPMTHNFQKVLKYQNKYMGNASNLANLFNSLPLGDISKQFQLYSKELGADINYLEEVSSIEDQKLMRSLIYNATAAFVLIDNLQTVRFNFTDSSYTVQRSNVERWYGTVFTELTDKNLWTREVQKKLGDSEYVNACSKALLEKKKMVYDE